LNVVHTGQAGSLLWQAYDDGKKRMVGIKTLQPKFCDDREQVGYLRQEYKVGLKATHPRVIEVYCFDIDRGGAPYLAMEWFPAPNLKQRIHQGGYEKIAYLVPKIIEEAAEGLAAVHAQGWVHRDIKPDNFLVSDDGEVKLIDLGLAVRARHGLFKLFAGKSKIQGTPSYMSPEQIRGAALDQRADVYSFGCMVHELVSGKPPFTGINTNELLTKHLKANPPSLQTVSQNVTTEFAQLVRRSMAKEPKVRPSSMEGFLDEFRACKVYKIPPRRPSEVTQ
jgi:eukaryotic-like serine/threonine-protein kinase